MSSTAAASSPPEPSGTAPSAAAVSVPTEPSGVVASPVAVAPAVQRDAGRTHHAPLASPAARRYGRFTLRQWVGGAVVIVLGVMVVAAIVVLVARWVVSLGPVRDFMAEFPGQYAPSSAAPVGFPAWVGWQHFLNVFFMVLIIRSGWRVRTEKRPSAFWSPKWNPARKISLGLWFHQSLDILWLVNGVAFVVLLFCTGQWMRIVPTSWDVFPDAATAALKYASLNWPTDDGWANYNSLQLLSYFATVFLAAPLAVITGVRMSGLWPKKAKALSRLYPVEWARAVHFPVMVYFVLFIIVHVTLVLATGALRNLNHMYGGSDNVNWIGFWLFVVSLVVIAAGWVAARPLVLAPIARLFGKVSGR